MATISIPYNFAPRSYQLPVFEAFDRGIKRFCEVWHRRSGKDSTFINAAVREMYKRKGTYWVLYPELKQGRKIFWDGMNKEGFKLREHFPPELVIGMNNLEMKIELENGSMFQVVGADKLDKRLVGTNPIGVIFSEYSLMSPATWDFVRPILLENDGWAAFLFTPRGKNHAFDLWNAVRDNPLWHTSLLTVNETRRDAPGEAKFNQPVMTPEGIHEEVKAGMDEDLVLQEFYCKWTGYQTGSYYGRILQQLENEGRIGAVSYDPRVLVETGWDLGYNDATAIWFFQRVGPEVHIIDYYENNGYGFSHYAKVLQEKPYVYGEPYGPHDLNAHEIATGTTRFDTAWGLGIKFNVVPRADVQEGIDAVRNLLPRCHIDRAHCARGLSALWQYSKQYDVKTRTYSSKPNHDWASNGADALRTYAMSDFAAFSASGGGKSASRQPLGGSPLGMIE